MIESRNAILALILLSLLVYQFQRYNADMQFRMMQSEIYMVASGIGTQLLDEIGLMKFEDIKTNPPSNKTIKVSYAGFDELTFTYSTKSSYVKKKTGTDLWEKTATPTDFVEAEVTMTNTDIANRRGMPIIASMSRIYSKALSK